MNWTLRVVTLLLIRLNLVAATTCYTPDGYAVTDPRYIPCIAIEGENSMCCKLNDTMPDTCHSTGLCYSSQTGYWRDFCTDKNWDSPNCLKKTFCDDAAGGKSNWTTRVTSCGDGSWCCGDTNNCCTNGGGFTLDSPLVAIGNNATVTTTVTATPKDSNKGSSDSSTKVVIGVGVAVPLACLACGMLGVGFLWGRRSARQALSQPEFQRVSSGTAIPLKTPQAELGHEQQIYEVSGNEQSYELPTTR
ncbi:hypothetical protein AFLA70_137g002531 [Aspergillus flavus AF70]|nr:hypothetical protein AFLA70_137g002531 [Aspergillus flavus AF70]